MKALWRNVVKCTIPGNTGERVRQVNPWRDQNGTGWQWDALVAQYYKHAFGCVSTAP